MIDGPMHFASLICVPQVQRCALICVPQKDTFAPALSFLTVIIFFPVRPHKRSARKIFIFSISHKKLKFAGDPKSRVAAIDGPIEEETKPCVAEIDCPTLTMPQHSVCLKCICVPLVVCLRRYFCARAELPHRQNRATEIFSRYAHISEALANFLFFVISHKIGDLLGIISPVSR